MQNLVTRKQAAAILGVTVPALDRALQAGRISYADPDKRLFDEAGLRAQWATNRRRQRKPIPVAAAGDPAAPGDDSVPALQHRRLRAEVTLMEHKAKVTAATRVSTRSIERALFRYYTMGRAAVDAAHPKLLDRLDEFCPERDPRYAALYADLFRLGRETWVNVWLELAATMIAEHPQWARPWFVRFAASESRPGSAAHVELERMEKADEPRALPGNGEARPE